MATDAASIVFGTVVLFGGPLSSLFGVALFLSLEMVLQRASCIAIAGAARRPRNVLPQGE
jgi:uncharacterized membrane protein HdeD (DUF308 family)